VKKNNSIIYKKENIVNISETLVKAFINYPLFTFLSEDIVKRRKILRMLIQLSINYGMKNGKLITISDKVEAVALVLPSNKDKISILDFILCGGLKFLFKAKLRTIKSLAKITDFIISQKKRIMDNKPYLYLEFLGVMPENQNQGLATKLLKQINDICKKNNIPCYLETFTEKNAEFYKRNGFILVEKNKIPYTELIIYSMIR
jgi:N-acetylglutamate synthase-like GNAT family acetyltransferase